jgi:hypothetical protein
LAQVAWMRMEIILQRAQRRWECNLDVEPGIHKSIGWQV